MRPREGAKVHMSVQETKGHHRDDGRPQEIPGGYGREWQVMGDYGRLLKTNGKYRRVQENTGGYRRPWNGVEDHRRIQRNMRDYSTPSMWPRSSTKAMCNFGICI